MKSIQSRTRWLWNRLLHELQSQLIPHINQSIDKFDLHLIGVVRSWSNTELFFSSRDGWVVDVLHVDTMLFHQQHGCFGAQFWVTNLCKEEEERIEK